MSLPIQLDFFRTSEECEIIALREEVKKLNDSQSKVRKKLFACNGELTKRQYELEKRLEVIEKGLCYGK